MKSKYWLLAMICVLLTACGDVEWFPDNNGSTGDNGNNGNNGGTTVTSPTLTQSIAPSLMVEGDSATLTFTIQNATGNPAQSGMGFVNQLPSGLTATVQAAQCGGNASLLGTRIIFISGQLASGVSSCTITATLAATLAGAEEQTFVNASDNFSSLVGGLVSGVQSQSLRVLPTAVTGGGITVSDLVPAGGGTTSGTVAFTFEATTFNNTGLANAVDATVTVVALDASGTQIASTLTPLAIQVPDTPLLRERVALNATPKEVPQADADRIELWRLLSVTVP